ncbi:MAG: ABC transporter ATP-binding protein [Pseudomonadota bacterium]|nr:ABC transporter ATP-binding protein [Pseudomonadota bacterium]
MLDVNTLNKTFGPNRAVQNLSFSLQSGEVLCLLGANGAGKTTTLNMLLGFTQPDSGEATLDGVNMHRQTELCRQHMMYIPENVHLYPSFSALENVAYLAELADLKVSQRAMIEALERTGIDAVHHHKPLGSFSKGMRQKVAIAFALLKHAKLVLMDEPTSGLDPVATREFIEVINTIKARGTAVLIVTHDLLCAHELADHIGIMHQGQLKQLIDRQDLSLAELNERYFNQFAA